MVCGTEYKNVTATRPVESAQHRRPKVVLIYNGEKYELRKAGPFFGRFTTGGKLVNIDGEDYMKLDILCPVLNTSC